MIAVIFEVQPNPGQKQTYLDIAAELRAHLQQVDGFISIERFQSLVDDNKILSLSFFRDEAAIKAWRNLDQHRSAQSRGRADIFANYRIRVAEVVRDYSKTERQQVPEDSSMAHTQ